MSKRAREKIALLVFALLILLGASVLMRYFETGRTWNVGATLVDDVFGQMQGYSAVVFDGTVDPTEGLFDVADRTESSGDAGEDMTQYSDSASGDSHQLLGDMVLSKLAMLPNVRSNQVYVSQVRDLYEKKEAGVATIDGGDPAKYTEPRLLKAGDRTIGVVTVDYYATERSLEKLARSMRDAGAETLVCLAPRLSFLSTPEAFDAVLITDDEEAKPGYSRTVDSTHVMYVPQEGEVGVMLFTNLNVPSSKVYTAL